MSKQLQAYGAGARSRPRVYLAGPDVFLPDAIAYGSKKKALCRKYGLEGIFPLDVLVDGDGSSRRETGLRIYATNEALIRSCVAIIANMTPFRGVSADVGTACEMGLARGFGLVVFAYSNCSTPFAKRNLDALGQTAFRDASGRLRDSLGMEIEEFDLIDNLMLEGTIHASGGSLVIEQAMEEELFTSLAGFEKCVRIARDCLLRETSPTSQV